ncbi:MAG: TIGR03016 family PEP-CTERM system-associated outer membrane protein [Gammaproteobacteria bacterium]
MKSSVTLTALANDNFIAMIIASPGYRAVICRTASSRKLLTIRTLGFALSALGFSMASAQAAEWRILPALTVSGTYHDNITQAPSGAEESDFVTEVNPGISIQADGSRLNLDLSYTMQNLFYAENSDDNTTNHELTADANAELMRKFLFLDVFGSYQQVLLSPEGTGGSDNTTITDNRTDAWTYSLSPYAVTRFGNLAAELRYTFEKVGYAESEAETAAASDTQSIFANLASDPSARRLSRVSDYRSSGGGSGSDNSQAAAAARQYANNVQWSVTYARDQTDFKDDTDDVFENIALDTSYRVGARTAFLAGLGYENNEFEQSDELDKPEGLFWYTGVAWSPSRRTSLEATIGRRFYGTTYSLDVQHATRTISANIQYAEDFTTSSGTLLENQLTSGSASDSGDAFSDPVENPQSLLNVPLPGLSSDVFLRRRLTGEIAKQTAKSTFSVSAFGEKREFQSAASDEQVFGFAFVWDWRFASRTDSSLTAEWQRQEFDSDNREDDFWQVGLNINRRMSQRMNGYVDYRYGRRDSTEPEDDYTENVIAAGLQVQF